MAWRADSAACSRTPQGRRHIQVGYSQWSPQGFPSQSTATVPARQVQPAEVQSASVGQCVLPQLTVKFRGPQLPGA